ncbi:MAG: hypothetical protein FWE16_02305 [Firmicutes bacterium]|nr:hypothetical protein [Bacillota bacterium]
MERLNNEYKVEISAAVKNSTIFKEFGLENVAFGLAHFCFRNGPIEDIHAKGQRLTEARMEELNKFCVNRIYSFFKLIEDGDTDRLRSIVQAGIMMAGTDWDKPEFDAGEFAQMTNAQVCKLINSMNSDEFEEKVQ